jgi:hypothetical protein
MYRVYARRWLKFPTLEAAKTFCDQVFERTGIVLGIEEA